MESRGELGVEFEAALAERVHDRVGRDVELAENLEKTDAGGLGRSLAREHRKRGGRLMPAGE